MKAVLVFAHIVSEDEVASFRETLSIFPSSGVSAIVLAFAIFVLDGSFLVLALTVQRSRFQALLVFAHVVLKELFARLCLFLALLFRYFLRHVAVFCRSFITVRFYFKEITRELAFDTGKDVAFNVVSMKSLND